MYPLLKPRDVRHAEACKTWILCLRTCQPNERDRRARLEAYLERDMHEALHHRPHQPEY